MAADPPRMFYDRVVVQFGNQVLYEGPGNIVHPGPDQPADPPGPLEAVGPRERAPCSPDCPIAALIRQANGGRCG